MKAALKHAGARRGRAPVSAGTPTPGMDSADRAMDEPLHRSLLHGNLTLIQRADDLAAAAEGIE